MKTPVFFLFMLCYLLLGAANNFSYVILGFRMVEYPAFLLYGTTILYTLVFGIFAYLKGESWTLSPAQGKNIILLGIFAGTNGVLGQYALPHLAPELSNLIVAAQIPLTWALSYYKFRLPLAKFDAICFVLIFASLLAGIVRCFHGDGQWFNIWAAATLGSSFAGAFQTIYLEIALRRQNTPRFVCLTTTSLVSLGIFVLSIPLEMSGKVVKRKGSVNLKFSQLFEHQKNAFKCALGMGHDHDCLNGAPLWVCIFLGSYIVFAWMQASLLSAENRGSNTIANLSAILTPIGAMSFWIKPLAGPQAQSPTICVGVSAFLLCIFEILYESRNAQWIPECLKVVKEPAGERLIN